MNERSLFLAALDISDPSERSAYLARACARDEALRARVEVLLRSHREAGSYLGTPALAQGDRTEAQGDTGPRPPDPEETQAEPAPAGSSGDDALRFLAPGRQPGSLGRLAHYEVQEVLGQGGFGTVLKAFDEKLHRVVAIKVLAPALATGGTARQRFVREARMAAAVRHEHIVVIHAVDDDPLPYLVMECIVGQTLQEKLDRGGPMEVKEILRIGHQVAAGLAAAHAQGLVHRDIKPANILLENGIERVKITDFGLARAADDASLTQSGVIAGTPMFMAPEQALGEAVDHRADLFSLGSVLYVLCTGRPPFRAASTLAVLKRVCEDTPRPVSEVNSEIPDWLEAVVARLMAKKPEERFSSAQQVADLLGEGLADMQGRGRVRRAGSRSPAQTTAMAPRQQKPAAKGRRSSGRRWAVALGLLALAGLVAGAIAYLNWPRVPAPEPVMTAPAHFPAAKGDGWVSLFNGKDLTGWNQPAWAKAKWKVEVGNLTVQGAAPLFSEKKYKNFHCLAEVKSRGWTGFGLRSSSPGGDVNALLGSGHNIGGIWLVEKDKSRQILNPNPEIRGPEDTWLTVEGIVINKEFTVIINGVTTAKMKIEQVAEEGCIAVFTGSEQAEMSVRKVEIKELPLAPPDHKDALGKAPGLPGGPFVVARDGEAERTFAGLADAVAAARSGDTIEIRGDGPFETLPLDLGAKALVIRAGEGSRPVLRLDVRRPTKGKALLTNRAPLILEGIELQRLVDPADEEHQWTVVQAIGPLRMTNVRIEQTGAAPTLAIEGRNSAKPSPAEVVNSQLTTLWSTIDVWDFEADTSLTVRNSICYGHAGVHVIIYSPRSKKNSVRLERNTFAGLAAVAVSFKGPGDWLKPGRAAKLVSVEASANVVASRCALTSIWYEDTTLTTGGQVEAGLRNMVGWTEDRNLYPSRNLLETKPDVGPDRHTYEDWRKFWNLTTPACLTGVALFDRADPDLLFNRPISEMRKGLMPADLRLAEGSPGKGKGEGGRDLGADVDLVGPGPAYEKWKKTPEYQQWLARTKEFLAGK